MVNYSEAMSVQELHITITVVIPAYNASGFIADAIQSVMSQTYPASEIIVVNDGSEDFTSRLIEQKFPNVKLLQQNHLGVSSARNYGIAQANSTFIAFLDADDQWLPDHLYNAAQFFKKNSDIHWFTSAFNIQDQNEKTRLVQLLKSDSIVNFFHASLYQPFVNSSNVIIRKKVFETVGTFHPYWRFGEDLNMWFRVALFFPEIGYCCIPDTIIHRRPMSMSRNPENYKYRTTLKVLFHTDQLIDRDRRPEAYKLLNFWIENSLFSAAMRKDKHTLYYLNSRYRKRINFIVRFAAICYCIIPRPGIKLLKYINKNIRKKSSKFKY